MFGRRTGQGSIERLAAEAEALVLAMPPAERRAAEEGLATVVEGARQLLGLPSELIEVLWRLTMKFVLTMQYPGAKPGPLITQIMKGAPTLLAPYANALAELTEKRSDA